MVDLHYLKSWVNFIDSSLSTVNAISNRAMPIESIHQNLDDIGKTLKDIIEYRDSFTKQEKISVLNLSTIMHSTTLSPEGKVIIKVGEHIVSIKPGKNVEIENNFDKYSYSINRIGGVQELHYAHIDDKKLHQLVELYKNVKKRYQYRVGNRIELNTYGGTYKLVYIDETDAIITCKKWEQERIGNRKIKVSNIKGLAPNTFNSLTHLMSKK